MLHALWKIEMRGKGRIRNTTEEDTILVNLREESTLCTRMVAVNNDMNSKCILEVELIGIFDSLVMEEKKV